METPQHNEEAVKDEPYFTDGNIILSAESRSRHKKTRLFRVHTFMLSHNSPVFFGMLSLPPQPAVNETYEGIPVVRLTDDAEDLRDFLKALYDHGSLPLHDPEGNLADNLAGALRLATKYQADTMRAAIVQRIKGEWPQKFLDWIAFMGKHKQIQETYDIHIADVGVWESLPEPVSAINLAAEFDIPSILPAAFYLLALTDARSDWEDEGRWPYVSLWGDPQARWSRIKGPDAVRLLRGQATLFDKLLSVQGQVTKNVPACTASQGCQNIVQKKHGYSATCKRYDNSSWRTRPDIFTVVLAMIDDIKDMGLCSNCGLLYSVALQEHMLTVWNELPSYFGLTGSDEM